MKKCRLWYGHSWGTMQRRHLCQYSCSIHDNVVPMAVCTHVLFTLFVTVHLSFLSDRSWDTTDTDTQTDTHTHTHTHTPHKHKSQMLSSGIRLKRKEWPLRPCQQWTARTPPPDHSSLPQPKLSIQLKLSQLGLQLAAWAFGWAWQLVN